MAFDTMIKREQSENSDLISAFHSLITSRHVNGKSNNKPLI